MRKALTLALAASTALAVSLGVNPVGVSQAQAAAAQAQARPATVSADALPTVQINGVVWAQVAIGNTVYVTGKFTSARPAGAPAGVNETPRGNILAYDVRTGEMLPGFNASLNGEGLGITASPDGKRVYVVGSFTQANGVNRYRIAAFDAATGALVNGFAPVLNAKTRAVVAVGDAVYVGGIFTVASKANRARLAAFSASTGEVLPWAPVADAEVMAMTSPSSTGQIVVGGRFTTLNGVQMKGSGALHPVTGQTMPWAVQNTVRAYGGHAAMTSLTTDGTLVYGTAYSHAGYSMELNLENSYVADANGGAVRWASGCLGDNYSSFPLNGVLYTAGHMHNCESTAGAPELRPIVHHRAQAAMIAPSGKVNVGGYVPGVAAPQYLSWLPTFDFGKFTGQNQGPWSVTGTGDYLSYAGEFTKVNGKAQQGITRFAVRPAAPRKEGPQNFNGVAADASTSLPGAVRVTAPGGWDRDDETLTYQLLRGPLASAQVVAEQRVEASPWNRALANLVDSNPVVGSAQTYRIRAIDGDGNTATSATVSVTASAATASSRYRAAVMADRPVNHWRFEENGTVAGDWVGGNDVKLPASTTKVVGSDKAVQLPGNEAPVTLTGRTRAPSTFSLEAWVKTTSTAGGKIIGFGNSSHNGISALYDRHLYMASDGRLVIGAYNGQPSVVGSPRAYNDGQWHHVVGTFDGSALNLFVDGAHVGTAAMNGQLLDYLGHWRIGGDSLTGWGWVGANSTFSGAIDEVAVYPRALDGAAVQRHHAAGRSQAAPDALPTASFTASTADLALTVDASASTDAEGPIASYAWDFGDGNRGTGATARHTYATPGTRTVTLTVTDGAGGTATTSRQVTAAAVAAPGGVLASDSFARTVASGLGRADAGGTWTVSGGASNTSVSGGAAKLTAPKPGSTIAATLTGVSSTTSEVTAALQLQQTPTGGGSYVYLTPRTLGAGEHRVTARVWPDGKVGLSVVKRVGATSATLKSATATGLNWTAGATVRTRVQAVGTSPTTVRAKLWLDGTPEPTDWQISTTDTTPELQAPGAVGVSLYNSASSANVPVSMTVRDFKVVSP